MELILTIRKIVFGLLVLVLASLPHGIADAQDTPADTGGNRLTVRVDPFNGAPGTTATVTFTAIGADHQPAFVRVNLTAIGGTLSQSSELTGTAGSGTGTVTLTRGNTPGTENYVTASTNGYPSVRTRFLITGAAPPPTPTPKRVGPDALRVHTGDDQTGAVNTPLTDPFVVAVLDAYDDPVEDVRVRFRVTQGSGSFSPRTPRTDAKGLAETIFTPTSAGRTRIVATVAGIDDAVRFSVQATQIDVVPPVRPSTHITPKVHVAAANRPPMLWVDGGGIYALVGASPQRFAPSVDNALNIAVGGGKVYWTEMTGESSGTINSANLDGSGETTELTTLLSVPMGIAVDPAGNKLYWTNARGRIQSANLDGSGIRNVLENLPGPMDIALSGGNAYWTQQNGSLRSVNLSGQKVVHDISTGSGTPGSLAIANGKVYWTEMTAAGGGTINSANLDGDPGATQLASILAAPSGIAVDTARSKLYWTNSRGRIQRANLDGSGIKTVVDGLGKPPGEIVVSNNITETLVASAPTIVGLKRNRIQEQINLRQLLMTETRPERTELLANYPNPFNPETWIPYQLAEATDVTVTIYDMRGIVVRRLALGHQPAGFYQHRGRAAYWNGRNAVGEKVASGLYFYTFTAGEFTATRKLLIRK